ncbi:MAG: NAD(P)/FAD-dependent oxidoreductase [Thermoplasmatales archaeon]|nr:MAG: NAD(P)/FAD-dependent oxidoreductase [Thermoplasmatales archaeon]
MKNIKIMGAGLSGLSAAINLVRAGYIVDVFEKRDDCGRRFLGDLEGFENWSSSIDAIDELRSMNVKVNFDCSPFKAICLTDGKKLLKNTCSKPIFYLVKRGVDDNSLDQGLKNQAIDLGVNIHFNSETKKENMDIISTGVAENKYSAIAKGISFETESDDIAVALLNKKASNNGYSYLLISKGYGTMCSINFYETGINANAYFKKTYEIITKLFDIDIKNEENVGGIGCFLQKPRLVENNKIYTGEAAGLQDYLWGFGMRYAVTSGFLAALSIIEYKDYEKLIEQRLSSRLKTSVVNRFIVEKLGDRYYALLLRFAKKYNIWIDLLHRRYNPSWYSRIIYPFARWSLSQKYINSP